VQRHSRENRHRTRREQRKHIVKKSTYDIPLLRVLHRRLLFAVQSVQGSAQILCCNTEAFDNPVTKKREDKDIDTIVPKPCGPQRPVMLVGLLFLCRERSTVRREGHLMSRVRVRGETGKKWSVCSCSAAAAIGCMRHGRRKRMDREASVLEKSVGSREGSGLKIDGALCRGL